MARTAFGTAFEVEEKRLDREAQSQKDSINAILKIAAQDPAAGTRLWNETFGKQFGTVNFKGSGKKFDQFTLRQPDGSQRRFATKRGEDPPRVIELDIPIGDVQVGALSLFGEDRIKKAKFIQDKLEAIDPSQIVETATAGAIVPGGKKTIDQQLRGLLRGSGNSPSDARKISDEALKLKRQGVTNYIAKAIANIEKLDLPEEFDGEPLREREGLFEEEETAAENTLQNLDNIEAARNFIRKRVPDATEEELNDPGNIDAAMRALNIGG